MVNNMFTAHTFKQQKIVDIVKGANANIYKQIKVWVNKSLGTKVNNTQLITAQHFTDVL